MTKGTIKKTLPHHTKTGKLSQKDKDTKETTEEGDGFTTTGDAVIRSDNTPNPYIPGITKTIKKKKEKSKRQKERQLKAIEKGIATADVLVERVEKNETRLAKKARWKKIY